MSDAPRYETSDAPARPLLIAGVVLAVVLVLSLFVGDWLARRFLHDITSADQASPVQKLRREPLGPELDVVPGHDLVAHRAWEEEHLGRCEPHGRRCRRAGRKRRGDEEVARRRRNCREGRRGRIEGDGLGHCAAGPARDQKGEDDGGPPPRIEHRSPPRGWIRFGPNR